MLLLGVVAAVFLCFKPNQDGSITTHSSAYHLLVLNLSPTATTQQTQVVYGGDQAGAAVCAPTGTGGEWRWSPVQGAEHAPPDRTGHAAALLADGGVAVLGGVAAVQSDTGAAGAETSDIALLRKGRDGAWAWAAQQPRQQAAGAPVPGRSAAAAAALPSGTLLVFGGEAGGSLLAAPYAVELEGGGEAAAWAPLELRDGDAPLAARKGAASCAAGEARVVLFGGQLLDADEAPALTDELVVLQLRGEGNQESGSFARCCCILIDLVCCSSCNRLLSSLSPLFAPSLHLRL